MSMIPDKHDIEWNGQSLRFLAESHGFQLLITKIPDLNRATRKCESYSVPGRSGNIIIPQDAWENITLTYEIMIGNGDRGSAPEAARLLAEWLSNIPSATENYMNVCKMLCSEYHSLSDTFDHGYERRAVLMDGYNIESKYTKYAYATVSFNCRPERYQTQGMRFRSITALNPLYSPHGFTAKPALKFTKSGSGSSWGFTLRTSGNVNYGVTITGISSITKDIIIDSESEECYFDDMTSANANVTLSNGFPRIIDGAVLLNIAGGALQVMPRFWCL